MSLSCADDENYTLSESDFSDDGACSTEVGEGVIEVYDVGFFVETGDEGFHGGMAGGLVVT